MKKCEIDPQRLGGKSNPICSTHDLIMAMTGKRNCYLYTYGYFPVPEGTHDLAKMQNIEFIVLDPTWRGGIRK